MLNHLNFKTLKDNQSARLLSKDSLIELLKVARKESVFSKFVINIKNQEIGFSLETSGILIGESYAHMASFFWSNYEKENIKGGQCLLHYDRPTNKFNFVLFHSSSFFGSDHYLVKIILEKQLKALNVQYLVEAKEASPYVYNRE